MELANLGFDEWFEKYFTEKANPALHPARVCAVDKDSFVVTGEYGEVQATVTGKLRFEADSNIDFPVIGDWVCVEYFDNQTLAIIHNILPRKTLLKRKSAGKKIDYQVIGANIDTACIMQSLDMDFNIPRLERYLVAALEAGITPAILLSKSDLINPAECRKKISEIKEHYPSYKIIPFSNKSLEGMEEIKQIFFPGKTYCIIGSSGVGKTTLLNKLFGTEAFATKELRSKNHGGKHTTARRQLIPLESGALYIDTPGMRELGIISADSGIMKTFPDIKELSEKCRFQDCTHTNEPGCAVQRALQTGELPVKRFKNYIKIKKESEHYASSYVEKRKKDKAFGKMCKSIMKGKKKTRPL